MTIRKVPLFDVNQIAQTTDATATEKTSASASEAVSIDVNNDILEQNGGITPNDLENLGLLPHGWSVPDYPEHFMKSKSIDAPVITDAVSPDTSSAAMRFGLDVFGEAFKNASDSVHNSESEENPFIPNPLGQPQIPDWIRNLHWSAPNIPLKISITSDATEMQTDLHRAGDPAPTDKSRTSIDFGNLPDSPSNSGPASEISSIFVPESVVHQQVEDLLNQIKGLLLSVPQDQQAYWQNLFDEKLNAHFYEAHAQNSWTGSLSLSNVVFYPRENINWNWALEDFQAFFEQLQAAQQQTQVPVSPPASPEG